MDWLTEFPQLAGRDLRLMSRTIDQYYRSFSRAYGDTIEAIFRPLLEFLLWFERLLIQTPWWIILLVIVGNGPCQSQLHDQVSHLGIADRVLMLGERGDIPLLLSCFDGLVLASRSEGQPLSVIEAMACKLPVIGTSVGGIPTLVRAQKTGLLVPPEDAAALAIAIDDFVRRPEHFRQLGARGAELAEREFSILRMLDEYDDVYETALQRATPLAKTKSGN